MIRTMTIEDYEQVHDLWMKYMVLEFEVWMIQKKVWSAS